MGLVSSHQGRGQQGLARSLSALALPGVGRRQWCCFAAAIGLSLTILTFFPGHMNRDALLQLSEARAMVFYDWHPPLMSWIWSGLDRVMPGPLGMFVFHNTLFWAGLGLVIYLLRLAPAPSAILILAIGLFPPIFSALGTVWKDVGMASSFLTRLRLGAKITDAKTVLKLYHNRISAFALLMLVAAAVAAIVVALAVSDVGRTYLHNVDDAWHSVGAWLRDLFT